MCYEQSYVVVNGMCEPPDTIGLRCDVDVNHLVLDEMRCGPTVTGWYVNC